MTDFPSSPHELGAEQLTQYLTASGHLSGATVSAVHSKLIGTGKMGDNARFDLTYNGDAGGAPRTIVGKFAAADETARAMAGGGGAYFNEVMFYREFASQTSMRTPEIYASELTEDRTEFLLVMEDLSPAEPGSAFVGESRPHAELALAEAVKLATAFHGQVALATCEHTMGGGADRGEGAIFAQSLMEDAWPRFLERFGRGISDECRAFGDQYVANYARYATRYDGPRTLCHGDFRSENILFDANTAITVDWQTPSYSPPLTDIAYFLGGSVDIEDRRAWERELVADSCANFRAAGIDISDDAGWEQYREASMHGILITVLGATYSSADERGDRMFLTMIQRHLQHCVDMNATEFLS